MLEISPFEPPVGRSDNPFISPTEDYFDTLIKRGWVDDAAVYMDEYIKSLEGIEYDHRFFRVALKAIALPMYKKYHADRTGRPYYESRHDIGDLYQHSREMLAVQRAVQTERLPMENDSRNAHRYMYRLRGDMSEQTFFALMARPMTGLGDDFSVLPSPAFDNEGTRGATLRDGYDFVVHDRRNDTTSRIQIKTSHLVYKLYQPDINVISMRSIAHSAETSLTDLQDAIVADSDHDDPVVDRAMNSLYRKLDELHSSRVKKD